MKVAILNDTHCGVRNSSDIFLDYQARFYEETFFPYLTFFLNYVVFFLVYP